MSKLSRIVDLSRRRAGEGHLGLWRQLGEMVVLRAMRGVGPGYYHTAGFWRRDLSWEDKTGQLSEREYRRCLRVLNPPPYRKLSQNKIPEKAILALHGIPTPRFLGRLHMHVGRTAAGGPLRDAADLEHLARHEGATRMVFKPLEGWGGRGVHIPVLEHGAVLTFRDDERGETGDAAAYCRHVLGLARGGDWIVEAYFPQHPVLAAINPDSVNTLRLWVLDHGADGCGILTAFLRIGRAGSVVDNTSRGGIVAPVDLASGRLAAAREACADHAFHARHPDHGAPIEGVMLPYWADIRDVAMQALSVFPEIRFAGLDVAVGPSGPAVLELNVSPDRKGAAYGGCHGAPLREAVRRMAGGTAAQAAAEGVNGEVRS